MDSRLFNLARYCLSFVILCISAVDALALICCAIFVLLLNNFLDDIAFYRGNLCVRKHVYCNGIISPVNGVVTHIEKDVELFSGIKKVDPLTHDEIMSLASIEQDDSSMYNHLTIFLNKFNHHVVVNPSTCRSVSLFNSKTGNIAMVADGELVGDNKSYLCNDAIIFRYDSFYAVVTLDKFVSDYILGTYIELSPSMLICKGSQCDLYFDSSKTIAVKENDIVNIGDAIAKSKYGYIDDARTPVVNVDYDYVKELVSSAIARHGGVKGLLLSNIAKTLETFKNPIILVSCVVGVILYTSLPLLSYVAFSSIISFVIVRWYRNLMYSVMNYVGMKPWIEASYSAISKLSILWRTRKNKSR